MSCEEVRELLVGYAEDSLDATTRATVAQHLPDCPDCQREQVLMARLLQEIASTPPELPDREVESGFLLDLEREKQRLPRGTSSLPATTPSKRQWWFAGIAATIALVVAGGAFFYQQQALISEMANLEMEYRQLNKLVALTLMEDQSASKRLQAVQYATALPEQDQEVIEALIEKMRHDKHVNVRLAAAGALARFPDSGNITSAFIEALKTEQHANMQIELIQLLVSAQEEKAIPVMRQLLQREEVPPYVKDQISSGLNQLI